MNANSIRFVAESNDVVFSMCMNNRHVYCISGCIRINVYEFGIHQLIVGFYFCTLHLMRSKKKKKTQYSYYTGKYLKYVNAWYYNSLCMSVSQIIILYICSVACVCVYLYL